MKTVQLIHFTEEIKETYYFLSCSPEVCNKVTNRKHSEELYCIFNGVYFRLLKVISRYILSPELALRLRDNLF